MADAKEVKVPDIGDFDAVDVIEVLVKPGDTVEAEDSLITLESDKATMEVPAPFAGRISELRIGVGDKVAEGDVILLAEPSGDAGEAETSDEGGTDSAGGSGETASAGDAGQAAPPAPQPTSAGDAPADADCDVVVVGAGPGGYTAAFRAADLGLKTVLIERYPSLGGVCLNVGCIPSKALLHAGALLEETRHFAEHGITFGEPEIDTAKLGEWKDSVVGKLTGGLKGMAKQRKVEVVHGVAEFAGSHELTVRGDDGERRIRFRNCIIAAGSRPVAPPGFDLDHPRIMDSTDALKLEDVPERLLVVGGGIIGLEMGSVYHALGSKVTVVEMLDRIMAGGDPDIVKVYRKRIDKSYENIFLESKVTAIEPDDDGVTVHFEGEKAPESDRFDRVLVSVGRRPNSDRLNLEAAGVGLDERGCIPVNEHQQTSVAHIYAIGDIVGQPMLAHKATHEGKVAAECCAGEKSAFDARVIPSVAYTNPEVAWVGVTEEQAKAEGLEIEKAQFPWAANGRALSLDASDGVTKLIFDAKSERIIGGSIVGPNAGDLISEVCLAIEMGADCHDIGLTVHPHPTLSETVAMAAEAAAGTLTDLYMPKKKK
ncbi:Soluble pyridine nucleotide transhydrogenase [wastewater metagenome]|uniref:dihydrolipoyl dehydrogenase n=2 Tax=unclassified sequences TaxID=12908 RepID=A0A5B8R5Z5_9ZZZZ|nr:soluble pyridine nucleotide transhydrogenase [uncultured organism]